MLREKVFRAKWLAWGVIAAVSLLMFPAEALAAAPAVTRGDGGAKSGAMLGFIYGEDGKTPVEGAMVKLRGVQNGKEFESGPTDKNGMYSIKDIEEGRYTVGVATKAGNFNFDYELMVKAEETAKLNLSLTPLVAQGEEPKGETRIGHIIMYLTQTGEALVYIERGLLQVGDKIHVKGAATDFYQDAKSLKSKGKAVGKALAGQNYFLVLEKPAVGGDIIYIMWKGGVPPAFMAAKPFFLTPLGIVVIAGSAAMLLYGGIQLAAPAAEASPAKK